MLTIESFCDLQVFGCVRGGGDCGRFKNCKPRESRERIPRPGLKLCELVGLLDAAVTAASGISDQGENALDFRLLKLHK